MELEGQLQQQRERARSKQDPVEREVRAAAIAAVAESGRAEKALGVGDTVPRFTLPDPAGQAVAINDVLAHGPAIISFYRGGWCPFCNLELRALQSRLGEVHAAGGSLVAISPETPDLSLSTVEKNNLDFTVLSDHDNTVARTFGLVHRIDPSIVAYQKRNGHDVAAYNGTEVAEVPLPATYVIDQSGIVRFAFVSADFTRRADPDDVIEAIQHAAGPQRR
jgi:peroxiredoxin